MPNASDFTARSKSLPSSSAMSRPNQSELDFSPSILALEERDGELC